MDVKNSSQPFQTVTSKFMPQFWMSYFFLFMALIGSTLAVTAYFPIYFLSPILRPAKRWRDQIMQKGIWLLMKLQPWFNADIQLQALKIQQKNRPGRLLIANHRSHLDVFIFLSRVCGIRVLANQMLFGIPVLGTMMRLSDQISVPKGELKGFFEALRQVQTKLQDNQNVLIFPELTRCQANMKGTLPFSTAPFRIALQGNHMIYPISISGTDAVWPKGTMGLRYRKNIRIQALEPVDPSQFKTAEALCDEVRSRITESLSQ